MAALCLSVGIGYLLFLFPNFLFGFVTFISIITLVIFIWLYRVEKGIETEVNKALNFLLLTKADDQDIYLVINYNGYPSSIFYQDHNYASEGKKAAHQITKVEYAESVTLYLIIFGDDDPRNLYVVNEVVNSINRPTVYLRRE